MREEGGKADNATNPTDSIELSLTVVPRSSRSRKTIRLSPSLSLPLPLPLPPRFLSPRVETGPSRFDSLRGVESGEGVASPRISVDRKRWRNREEGGRDAFSPFPSRRKVYETFSLNLCSLGCVFLRWNGKRAPRESEGTRAPGAAGRWPVIAMRYGGHFSLK